MLMSTKIQNLKRMHKIILSEVNDENLILIWLMYYIPDCPDEEDFEFIASDTAYYNKVVTQFIHILSVDK